MTPSINDPRIYEMLVANIREYAIFLLGPDGTIQSWNLGAQLIKGYSKDEIVGRHLSVFYPREAIEKEWPERELRTAAADGRFEDEGWRVRKDGSRFWANVVITALRQEDGRLIGFSKITRDVTVRRANEEKLRQGEERFRLLIEGVEDSALYTLDNEGRVSSWNAGAQRIYGYAPSEMLGRHFSWVHTPEDVKAGAPWQELDTARAAGRAVREGWRVRKSGERFWARAILFRLNDAAGAPCGFAKVTQDLTERRQLREAEETARRLNEFIAMLAHELRNPLAPILHAAETMERASAGDAAHSDLLKVIKRQGRHLARIINDLLDVNRITRGTFTIERGTVDIGDVVERAVETVRPVIDAAGHRLDIALPEEPLHVIGDVHRLTQVLANILHNASRYTRTGGTITVTARRQPDEAVVSVQDTGYGIDPEDLERIFNLFDQGSRYTPGGNSGLGIGLTLARRIVEMHGGTIEVESAGRDKGSAFHVRIPRGLAPISRPELEAQLRAVQVAASSRRRVLVVDDHVDAARMLELLLQSQGHETRIAHDGPTALRTIEEFDPEFVFLDIGIPGMNGYEIAKKLKSADRGKSPYLVAVTGWGQPSDFADSKEAGFDLHLVKPVDMGSLKRLLENPPPGIALH